MTLCKWIQFFDLISELSKFEWLQRFWYALFVQMQEIQNQLARQSKEEEEIKKMRQKERENEQKAQQKYKNWLKKKNQEKMELEKREKVRWTLSSLHESQRLQDKSTPCAFLLRTGKSRPEGGAGARAPQEGRREI